jgi:hypothetical protein
VIYNTLHTPEDGVKVPYYRICDFIVCPQTVFATWRCMHKMILKVMLDVLQGSDV